MIMKTRIRTQGMLIFFGVLSTIALAKFIIPYHRGFWTDEILDAGGLCLVLAGFLFRTCARGHKEERSQQSSKLVIDGPYRYVRNPMYFGTLLIGSGLILALLNFWVWAIFLAVYLGIYLPQIKQEREKLAVYFGKDYREYCRVTPAFFPRLRAGDNCLRSLTLKPAWIKKERISFILTTVVLITAMLAEDAYFFGVMGVAVKILTSLAILGSFLYFTNNLLTVAATKE